MGNAVKCFSQRFNKQTCRLVPRTVPLIPNVKQTDLNNNFKVIALIRLGIKPGPTALEADVSSTRPPDRLVMAIDAVRN